MAPLRPFDDATSTSQARGCPDYVRGRVSQALLPAALGAEASRFLPAVRHGHPVVSRLASQELEGAPRDHHRERERGAGPALAVGAVAGVEGKRLVGQAVAHEPADAAAFVGCGIGSPSVRDRIPGAENIGTRRLHTVMERLLDEISFDAPEMGGREVVIDASYVRERVNAILQDQELSRYIL